jgi:hypothetical protein
MFLSLAQNDVLAQHVRIASRSKKVALGSRVRPRNTIGVIRTKETTGAVTIMINSLRPLSRDYRVSRAANPSWRCRKLRRKLCHRFQAAAEWKHESCHCRADRRVGTMVTAQMRGRSGWVDANCKRRIGAPMQRAEESKRCPE